MSEKQKPKYTIIEFNKPDPVKVAIGRSYIRLWRIANSENPEVTRTDVLESIRRQT